MDIPYSLGWMFIGRLTQDLQLVRENTPVSEQETMSEEEEGEEMKKGVKKEEEREEKERKTDVKEARKEGNAQDEQTRVILLTPVKETIVRIMCRIEKGWER